MSKQEIENLIRESLLLLLKPIIPCHDLLSYFSIMFKPTCSKSFFQEAIKSGCVHNMVNISQGDSHLSISPDLLQMRWTPFP